jgi:hypothetical protein
LLSPGRARTVTARAAPLVDVAGCGVGKVRRLVNALIDEAQCMSEE